MCPALSLVTEGGGRAGGGGQDVSKCEVRAGVGAQGVGPAGREGTTPLKMSDVTPERI